MGDFNINWEDNSSRKNLKCITYKFDLSQMINGPTRITNSTKTQIDLIFRLKNLHNNILKKEKCLSLKSMESTQITLLKWQMLLINILLTLLHKHFPQFPCQINTTEPAFNLQNVTETEVTQIIKSIKTSRATDVYGMDTSMLKELGTTLAYTLTKLINQSFT